MTMTLDANNNMYQFVSEDAEIIPLEKASKRPLGVSDISKALEEYKRLFKAGISSPAELITLVRAFPDDGAFSKAAKKEGMFDDDFEPMVVGGPASVELVDREGHLITTKALEKAFTLYMKNFRTRNAMVLHSDVQVGWALPAYITKSGNIYKSGVDPEGLFFITELRDDTRIAKRVMEQIKEGKLKSYSIAGSATKTQNIQKGMESYMQVDDMELAEVTVCEKGVNQGANFDILKANSGRPTSSCIDGSCLMKSEHTHNPTTILVKEDGHIDFLASLVNLVKDDNPFTNTPGKDDTEFLGTESYRKREQVHHQLLDAQGFPSEVEPEQNRYIPTAEIELDENSNIIHPKPPWVVNEAGQDLGTSYANEALTSPSAKEIHDKPYNLQKKADTRKPNAGERKVFDRLTGNVSQRGGSATRLQRMSLSKFVGLSGQRKKALIIEGHDSATDAFLSKDHMQYQMVNDQRTSSVPASLSRRKDVTSGQVSILPFLVDLARATTAKPIKKSNDCGCD